MSDQLSTDVANNTTQTGVQLPDADADASLNVVKPLPSTPVEPTTIPTPAPPAPETASTAAEQKPPELPEHIRAAAADILDKQYRLYTWNDAKTQALITTNSIMFAAIGFLYKDCLRDSLAMLFLTAAVISLGISLTTSLLQVIPRVSSGRSGAGPNTRSIRGISLYPKWEDYHTALTAQTPQTLLVDTVRQVYGMAANNIRSTKIIKNGVVLTIAAIVMLLGAIFTSAAAARGIHVLGEWQLPVGPASATTPNSASPTSTPTSIPTPPSTATPPFTTAANTTSSTTATSTPPGSQAKGSAKIVPTTPQQPASRKTSTTPTTKKTP